MCDASTYSIILVPIVELIQNNNLINLFPMKNTKKIKQINKTIKLMH